MNYKYSEKAMPPAHPGATPSPATGGFSVRGSGGDIYPDLVIGQTTTHPGVDGAWQTDDWLRHMVRNAMNPREVTIASGYPAHASSDVFAHSYLNNYAGDVFELGDERAVEIRQAFHPGKIH